MNNRLHQNTDADTHEQVGSQYSDDRRDENNKLFATNFVHMNKFLRRRQAKASKHQHSG